MVYFANHQLSYIGLQKCTAWKNYLTKLGIKAPLCCCWPLVTWREQISMFSWNCAPSSFCSSENYRIKKYLCEYCQSDNILGENLESLSGFVNLKWIHLQRTCQTAVSLWVMTQQPVLSVPVCNPLQAPRALFISGHSACTNVTLA